MISWSAIEAMTQQILDEEWYHRHNKYRYHNKVASEAGGHDRYMVRDHEGVELVEETVKEARAHAKAVVAKDVVDT